MSQFSSERLTSPVPFAALRAPREIIFGEGQRTAVGWTTAAHGTRVFVCVDPHIAVGDVFAELLRALHACGLTTLVYSDITPELPMGGINKAAEEARAFRADVLVAVGGGSSIDLAKVVALLLAHGGSVKDYYGEFKVPGPTLPVIAVPTTAGTGSEVTPVAVLTDTERGSKVGISSPYLVPSVAVCDPELTYTCPPGVTASAGVDALSHCIEAYTAIRRTADSSLARDRVFVGRGDLTDTLALSGMKRIVAGLWTAYTEPFNRQARADVMYGSLMAGLAFGTAGTAAAHALQYPVGALTHTPHGVGVGVLLPYVMEYNRPRRVAELAEIGRIFSADGRGDAELARQAPILVERYLATVGIPRSLAEIGLREDQLDWVAAQGRKATRLSENNPEPLTEAGARTIVKACWAGDIALVHDVWSHVGEPLLSVQPTERHPTPGSPQLRLQEGE